jgi:DNA-binding beta-propeller fold protein YncE
MHYKSIVGSVTTIVTSSLLFSGCVTAPGEPPALSLWNDAVITSFNGSIYILERRGADNIIKIDAPSTGKELFIIESDFQSGQLERYRIDTDKFVPVTKEHIAYQYHFGDNWNPQDIEFISSSRAYVVHADEPAITVFDPAAGAVVNRIDIAKYAFMPDSNSSPYASDLLLVGSDLYVLLQRRNGWNPGAPSLILKIDTANDSITDTIPLAFKNGFAMAHYDGVLYITNPGSPSANDDGAIEALTLATKEVRTVIEESTLGGNPNQIIHKNGTRFYVQNYVGWQDVRVIEIDVADGTIVATLGDIKDAFGGIVYESATDRLYVGERNGANMGIRVYENNQPTGTPIKSDESLPPIGMALIN